MFVTFVRLISFKISNNLKKMKMKKIILVLVAIAITAGVYAQAGSTNQKTSPQELNKNENQNLQSNPQDLNRNQQQNERINPTTGMSHPDGVMMQNGKLVKVKNGQTTILKDDDMTFSNGTKIKTDGTYTTKEGTKMTLKEGEHMDMSGKMIPMNKNKDKNWNHNPDSTRKKR